MAAVQLGVFVVPDAQDTPRTLAQIDAADAGGLDLVGVQGHPLGEDVAPRVRDALGQPPGGR